mmetsp:Transcript_17037/g.46710  ORF Transcript_17037/g.46710 Transcript_17037/m.46710 type:complete len:151 (+) Transcript_17037:117-569(+)|eukprot:CAMPEP_0168744836 /NCGR_PEP_ID=MMETSP0724-20121128/14300_1 /TAXON_ID=265536 /ORGANISM="Amphiprora sp., Strain CCMP467" /LENGTH=150 /DNA_ID=CAMNT_0008792515 /DNA_START=115 /DNA_END=567 /DNA_ORIENTATION=+
MVSVEIPDNYGYVVLTTLVGQFFVSAAMGGQVGMARSKYNVQYPNLYGTPGYHKDADAFNRVQRGHQNMFETLVPFTGLALVGGLKNPITCSICSVVYLGGCYLFQVGYSDVDLEVKTARYAKGGWLKWLGLLGAMGCSINMAGSLNKWW